MSLEALLKNLQKVLADQFACQLKGLAIQSPVKRCEQGEIAVEVLEIRTQIAAYFDQLGTRRSFSPQPRAGRGGCLRQQNEIHAG